MKEVKRWEAEDGSIFDSAAACTEHEIKERAITMLYDKSPIHSITRSEAEDLYKWLLENHDAIFGE